MSANLTRQLNEDQKKEILTRHGRVCFATGHPIAEGESVHFDHIKAFAQGGPTDMNNIAPMCEKHNKEKGVYSLYDFRVKLRMRELFSPDGGDKLTLQHELEFLRKKGDIKRYGETVSITDKNNESITMEFGDRPHDYLLHRCPITGWEYFYALLPVDVINSDDSTESEDGLQPRYLDSERVFELFRHFQKNPVLQPSLCRIRGGKVLTFDGQHKIAALLWNKRMHFECKVYVDPDVRLLSEVNLLAHEKYAQTRFFSPIMVAKLGRLFGQDFDAYRTAEDGCPKSEEGFFNYLRQQRGYTNAQINKQFRSWLYSQIDDDRNKMSSFVSRGTRSTAAKPITMDMLGKSIFKFMYRSPVTDDMATEAYLRDKDVGNMTRFCDILVEAGLGAWSTEGDNSPQQIKLKRVFGSKSMMAWSEILKDSICPKIRIYDTDEKEKLFYRHISDDDFAQIGEVVHRLFDWKMWDAPANSPIDEAIAGNKKNIKKFFIKNGLTTGYLMGAPE